MFLLAPSRAPARSKPRSTALLGARAARRAVLLALVTAAGACRPPETDLPGVHSGPAEPAPAVDDSALGRPTYKNFLGQVQEVGTAFLLVYDGGTFVATARHVVAGSDEDVQLTRRGAFVASSWHPRKLPRARTATEDDSQTDVEVLQARSIAFGAKPLELAPAAAVRGQRVFLLYFPRITLGDRPRDFELRGATVTRSTNRRLEFLFDGNPDCMGASGAPILDGRGRVVGVLTRSRGDGRTSYGLATPLESLRRLLAKDPQR